MANRFRVVPKERRSMDGILFASLKEMKRYAELRLLERAGEITKLEVQPEFKTFINGKPYCTYSADFSYWKNDGQTLVVEDVKSTGTAKDTAYRLRKKAAQLTYGFKVTEVIR